MASVSTYTGNLGLGVGSSPEIPVGANVDLNILNQTGDHLLALNAAKNKDIFDQKVKERDKVLQAIHSGDIKVGDLLEKDTPIVRQGLDKLDQAWGNMIKKGPNDIDAQLEYKKALRDATETVSQAQGRKVFYDQESQALAGESLPRKREARRQNLNNVINGGFWKDLTPYQQTQDLDINGSILSSAQNITEQIHDPSNPLIKGKRTTFDYGKTLESNTDNFLNDANKRYDQQQLMSAIQSLDPQSFQENIGAMNNRIKEYNDLKGLQPGQPGYVTPIQFEVNPQSGQPMIKEKLPDFAAKYTLAHQKPFNQVETEFDEKASRYLIDKQKADTDAIYKRAMASAAGMKARAYVDNVKQQMDLRKTPQEKDDFLDELWTRNFTNQNSLIEKRKEGNFQLKNINADESLPVYTIENGAPKQLIPIGAKPIKDDKGNIKYYQGGHYDTQYMFGDSPITAQAMTDIYDNMKKQQKGKWSGGFDDFLKLAIKNGKFRVILKGDNGTSDEELSRAAQQLISNKGTKKGQTGVFDNSEPPTDEQVPDQSYQ